MDELDTSGLKISLDQLAARMNASPFGKDAGIRLVAVEKGRARLAVGYQQKFIGNPLTGVVHGGIVTALLDHTSSIAVFSALDAATSIATLDLRIDYMRAADPGREIFAEAHCYKVTSSVAFVRGTAFHDTSDDPIASMAGTFMLASDGGRPPGVNLK